MGRLPSGSELFIVQIFSNAVSGGQELLVVKNCGSNKERRIDDDQYSVLIMLASRCG